jgi:4-amino-4-deoxy-L-arabinose transferase-like glycosyltransferase
MSASPYRRNAFLALPFLLVAAVGIFLRVHSFELIHGVGFDEQIYATYVDEISQKGPGDYPEVVRLYLQGQSAYPIALLPPTRVTFILAAGAWHALFGGPAVECVRAVSCAASVLVLLLSCAFAWRVRGRSFALAVLVLMAVAPTQIYMAHRALIDGFFTLVTLLVLWSLWDILQQSRPGRFWLALYSLGLVLLVLTKENAAFVYIAILGLLIANRWLGLGRVSRPLLAATLAAPLVGVALLALCAGGIEPLLTVFSLNASKSVETPYAITTGDGPWFRYFSDLLLVSPAVTLFAIGGAFSLARGDKAGWFLLGFVVFSYVPMCNVPYGMNLRYANMWDFPLRYLALVPVFLWTGSIDGKGKRISLLVGVVGLLAVFEFANYLRIFVANEVYDPVPASLLKALDILKP